MRTAASSEPPLLVYAAFDTHARLSSAASSSNFIQPAELLDFARRLKTHPPPGRLTLDLRKNPGDRAPDQWEAALRLLRPRCVVLVEGWTSSNTMADHVSNM